VLGANLVKLLVAVFRDESDSLRLMEYKLHLMIFSKAKELIFPTVAKNVLP